MPQGTATLFTHKSAGKHWGKGSQRWKAVVEVFWESPLANLPEPLNGWEVERELLCFNRRIMFRGNSPFGNRKGTEGIPTTRLGDLLMTKADGGRELKGIRELTAEFGSVASARWATKAYEAAPASWKAMLAAPKTSTAIVAAAKVVRTVLARTQEFMYWTVRGDDGEKVKTDHLFCPDEVSLQALERPVAVSFPAGRVVPMAVKGVTLLGEMGAPRARLCQTQLVGEDMRPAAPRVIRRLLTGPVSASRRRSEWEAQWGKKIDRKAVLQRRDSLAIPYRARDVVLRMHSKNLQVGGRLVFLGPRGCCPHRGEPETLVHCMLTCPVIQPVIGVLLNSLRMIDPADRTESLGDMLFQAGATRSGFPGGTLTAVTMRRIWLTRVDAVYKRERFHRKTVARAAIFDFMMHARVYRTVKAKKATAKGAGKQPRDPWEGLAGDERAAMARICEPGEQAKWREGFLSIWQNPRTFHRPP